METNDLFNVLGEACLEKLDNKQDALCSLITICKCFVTEKDKIKRVGIEKYSTYMRKLIEEFKHAAEEWLMNELA